MDEGTTQLLSYLSALGAGGLIGIVVKAILDRGKQKKKMLFDARIKAYAGITGRINNHFLESDIDRKSEALRFSQINSLLSEAYLLSSQKLKVLLDKYVKEINEFHNLLRDEKEKESKEKLSGLAKLATKINDQMRKDLYL